MNLLAVRPRPHHGECIAGHLSRLARANGFCDLRTFCMAGFGRSVHNPAHPPLNRLWELTAIELPDREKLLLTYHHDNTGCYYLYRNRRIPINLVAARPNRFCEQCLSEDGIWRAQWRLGWMPMCIKHAKLLRVCKSFCMAPSTVDYSVCKCAIERTSREHQTDSILALSQLVDEGFSSERSVLWTKLFSERLTGEYVTRAQGRYGRHYPTRMHLPNLTSYPLSPQQTVDLFNRWLEEEFQR